MLGGLTELIGGMRREIWGEPSGIRARSQKRRLMNKSVAIVRGRTATACKRFGAILVALSVLILAVGAGPPEIVRVHVPSAQATACFPAGTPLRMMAPDRFESLLDAATRGASRTATPAPPRLIRASHKARWNAGVLTGQSRLAVATPGSGPAALVLDPWTPMILASTGNLQAVGALESGKTILLFQPPTATAAHSPVTLDWNLRARPDSEGAASRWDFPETRPAS